MANEQLTAFMVKQFGSDDNDLRNPLRICGSQKLEWERDQKESNSQLGGPVGYNVVRKGFAEYLFTWCTMGRHYYRDYVTHILHRQMNNTCSKHLDSGSHILHR